MHSRRTSIGASHHVPEPGAGPLHCAASQPGASVMLDIHPDGTFLNTFADLDFEVYLQRRGSLNITSAVRASSPLSRAASARARSSIARATASPMAANIAAATIASSAAASP